MTGYFTKAPDYARVRVRVGGQFLDPVLDLYAPQVEPSRPIKLGIVRLQAGDNPVTFEVMGKSDASTGYIVGIDALVLQPAG